MREAFLATLLSPHPRLASTHSSVVSFLIVSSQSVHGKPATLQAMLLPGFARDSCNLFFRGPQISLAPHRPDPAHARSHRLQRIFCLCGAAIPELRQAEKQMSNLIRFGLLSLNLETGDLQGSKRGVRLPEQQFMILQLLLAHDGGVVSREEIQSRLWPGDTIVEFDRSINAAVLKLRSALRHTSNNGVYIDTVARRGYRLMVSVKHEIDESKTDSAQPAQNAPLVGQRISHYRVLSVLGGGRTGVVYKGEDLKLNRPVALKFLTKNLAQTPSVLKQLEHEARTASSLNHPNICTIYQIGEYERQPFIVMEFLEGEVLREFIAGSAGLKSKERAALVPKLLGIAIQVADGLAAAHARGVIHRDIKPANVIVTKSGTAKLLDFGLARQCVNGQPDSKISLSAEESRREPTFNSGIPDYMSPEQIKGEPQDQRSDLFSFGILLAELFGSAHPFRRGSMAETQEAILHDSPNLSSDLPPALLLLIRRLLARSLDLRYSSVVEVKADLERVAGALSAAQQIPDVSRMPLIGRDHELTELRRKLYEALAGHGSMVLIGGEAGVGKSYLARAVLEEAQSRGALGIVGHCYEREGAPPVRSIHRDAGIHHSHGAARRASPFARGPCS